ncbi:MAG: OmpA family protein, partial [Elusimicrobia bacterium]|nr:OmpA family protein [Elusimicrobiota bacterium]
MKAKSFIKFMFVALICVAVAGCAQRRGSKTQADEEGATGYSADGTSADGEYEGGVKIPNIPGESLEEGAEGAGGYSDVEQEADIRSADFTKDPELNPIYFALDEYILTDAERQIAAENVNALKSRKGRTFLVEGHCDERGTVEYNIALGQKRAKETQNYYIQLGIKPENIAA